MRRISLSLSLLFPTSVGGGLGSAGILIGGVGQCWGDEFFGCPSLHYGREPYLMDQRRVGVARFR